MMSSTETRAPGQWIVIAAILTFAAAAGVRFVMSPATWDPTTATVRVDDDVLQHWPDGRLNINIASEEELCLLPGIGPARARAIIEQREHFGPFESLQDIDAVHGIGAKTIEWFDDAIVLQPRE